MKSDRSPCWTSEPATAGFTQVMVTVNSYTGGFLTMTLP